MQFDLFGEPPQSEPSGKTSRESFKRKRIGNGKPNKNVYPDDPEYLETFYRLFGSGQSITVRQETQDGKTENTADSPVEHGDHDE